MGSVGRVVRLFRSVAKVVLPGLVLMVPPALAATGPAATDPATPFVRIAGVDRYDTARLLAESMSNPGSTAIVATGEAFPDALASSYLAGTLHAPILLTLPGQLPSQTSSALSALHPSRVIVVGAALAVSDAVVGQLQETAPVTRIGGSNRYDTARLVAENPTTPIGTIGGRPTAIIATGAAYADALAASPLAYATHLPILLTGSTWLPSSTTDALQHLGVSQVLIVGGTNAVSSGVEQQINSMGISTGARFAGADRGETAAMLASYAIQQGGFGTAGVTLARGDDFADGLAAAPVSADAKDPVVLTIGHDDLGQGAADFLRQADNTLTRGRIVGGPLAVSDDVAQLAQGVSQPAVLKDSTKALAAADLNGANLSSDGSTLTIPNPTEADRGLVTGDIVVAAPGGSLPSGLLDQIVSVASNGGGLTLGVVPAALSDAVDSGAFYSATLPGGSATSASFHIADVPLGPCSAGADTIDLSGSSFHMDVPRVRATWYLGIHGVKASLSVSTHMSAVLHATATNAVAGCDLPIPGLGVDIPLPEASLGPLHVKPVAKIGVFLHVGVEADHATLTAGFEASPNLEFQFDNGSIGASAGLGSPRVNQFTFTHDGQFGVDLDPSVQADFELNNSNGGLLSTTLLTRGSLGPGTQCQIDMGGNWMAELNIGLVHIHKTWTGGVPLGAVYNCPQTQTPSPPTTLNPPTSGPGPSSPPSGPGPPNPPAPGPTGPATVTISTGQNGGSEGGPASAPSGSYWLVVSIANFPPNSGVTLACYDNEPGPQPFYSGGLPPTDANGNATYTDTCFDNGGAQVHVTINGVPSNTITLGGTPNPPPPPQNNTYAETTGGVTHTWTNYSNAGGTEGPSIPSNATVQISCKLTGFRVADGNTWWYRIASSPWNDAYYASADAFYNNGQTSGSLAGTPFVDGNVPNC